VAFTQEDLSPDHVYMLDVLFEVYVWIGPLCSEQLSQFAMKVAMDYVKTHTDGRPKNMSAIYRVRSDQEPLSFTCHFLGWNGLLKASKRKRSTLQRVRCSFSSSSSFSSLSIPQQQSELHLTLILGGIGHETGRAKAFRFGC